MGRASPAPRALPSASDSGCPCSLRSSSSKLAQLTLEQILEHLDNLRLNLTNTKQNCRRQTLAQSSPGRGREDPVTS